MNAGGWIFLVTSVSLVWGLAGWCYYQVLFGKKSSKKAEEAR